MCISALSDAHYQVLSDKITALLTLLSFLYFLTIALMIFLIIDFIIAARSGKFLLFCFTRGKQFAGKGIDL